MIAVLDTAPAHPGWLVGRRGRASTLSLRSAAHGSVVNATPEPAEGCAIGLRACSVSRGTCPVVEAKLLQEAKTLPLFFDGEDRLEHVAV